MALPCAGWPWQDERLTVSLHMLRGPKSSGAGPVGAKAGSWQDTTALRPPSTSPPPTSSVRTAPAPAPDLAFPKRQLSIPRTPSGTGALPDAQGNAEISNRKKACRLVIYPGLPASWSTAPKPKGGGLTPRHYPQGAIWGQSSRTQTLKCPFWLGPPRCLAPPPRCRGGAPSAPAMESRPGLAHLSRSLSSPSFPPLPALYALCLPATPEHRSYPSGV